MVEVSESGSETTVPESVACPTETTPTSSDVALSGMLPMDWSSGDGDEV